MDARALPVGTLVHRRYRILKVLGAGGFGVTYQVEDLKEGGIAAMKEYFPLDMAYRKVGQIQVLPKVGCEENFQRFRDRFLEEAKLIYRYRGHPNIIHVTHLFYENETAYYVMEFIRGHDLGKLLEQNGQRLSWERLRPIFSQAVRALAEVHSTGVIHCDISPDNIFILAGGQVKLIDFGAAKSVAAGDTSIVLLKRGYAPPEQYSAEGRMGPWTDVYALAVTLYRAFAGRLPPASQDRLTEDRTVWPSQLGIMPPSPQWEQALRRAMALRPDQRYQDVTSFWNELTQSMPRSYAPMVVCRRGYFAQQHFLIRGETRFGTDAQNCQVVFPAGTEGVGRVHMRIWSDPKGLMVMDMGSGLPSVILTAGGQIRLTPGLVYPLQAGAEVVLGPRGEQRFCAAESR